MNHNDYANVCRCAFIRGELHEPHSPERERERFTADQLLDKAFALVAAAGICGEEVGTIAGA